MRYSSLLGTSIWALDRDVLFRLAHDLYPQSFIEPDDDMMSDPGLDVTSARHGDPSGGSSQIAVIPLFGLLTHRGSGSFFADGTTLEGFRANFSRAVASQSVGTIIIDVDSPGGSVAMVDETARDIRESPKTVIAQVNSMAASAAYYVASGADEIVATPSALVGSIGVYATHLDVSKRADQEGISVSLISAGKGKTDGNEFEPLGDDARSELQGRVNHFYRQFVDAVVDGRNQAFSSSDQRTAAGKRRLDRSVVMDDWQAKVYTADQALRVGMVDRVATIEETISRVATRHQADAHRSAMAADDSLRLLRAKRARVG